MVNWIVGFTLGFIVATIGVNGVILYFDDGVELAKEYIEQVK